MIIVEKNPGSKIAYSVSGSKVTFDDELMLNLTKYERDDAVHIDVCYDAFGSLVMGVTTGSTYVAEIDLPPRSYIEVEIPFTDSAAPSADDEVDDIDANDVESSSIGMQQSSTVREAQPLNMKTVTLTLWSID
ncbi:hypothetical protein FACS1894184_14180 [Clostridia bacterium]|nr:hypothetical protein FACS1894184_14180 [Clostridia bacterium]